MKNHRKHASTWATISASIQPLAAKWVINAGTGGNLKAISTNGIKATVKATQAD